MGLPIVTDECLNPMLGVGTDNELDVRIGADPRPPTFPAERGIYKDPNLGLWADPAPTYTRGSQFLVSTSTVVGAGKTVDFGPTTMLIEPDPVHSLLVSGMFCARMWATRADGAAADPVGQLKPRLEVISGSDVVGGNIENALAAGTGSAPVWSATVQVPFRMLIAPTVRRSITGNLRVLSSMAADWTFTYTARLLTATAVTVKPTDASRRRV